MEIINKYPSPLKMSNLSITKATFEFTPNESISKIKLSLSLNKNIQKISLNEYFVELFTELMDENNIIHVSVVCSANFMVPEDDDKISKDNLLNKSAISIMFPYIRSYITTITSVPNIAPIVLPPLNVVKFIEDQENLSNEP